MTFEQFWAVIAPYVQGFVGMTIAGIPVGVIIWAVIKKLVTKTVAKLLAGTSAESVADAVAKELAHSSIDVDLTAVTEEQLTAMRVEVDAQMKAVARLLDDANVLQLLTVKALSASEVIDDETKKEMLDAIERAGGKAASQEKKTIAVRLEPVQAAEPVTATGNGAQAIAFD